MMFILLMYCFNDKPCRIPTMCKIQEINYNDIIELSKKISNPFLREIYIFKIKEEFGHGFSIFYDMGNGIGVFSRNFIPNKDILLVEECKVSGGSIIFNLSTDINFIYKDRKECILKKNNFIVALSSSDFYVEIPLKKDKPLTTFAIGMKEELFSKIANSIKNIKNFKNQAQKDSYYIIQNRNIDLQQLEVLEFFKNLDSYEDVLKNIYLESKTTDLLHYTINKIANILNDSVNNITDKGIISSLQRAKEIIMEEYSSKLSIKNIAYKSAINECYLKKDFKKYYGMTILEMLQKRRLDVAKQLLKENLSVKEVALKIGYKHTGYFSKLFFDYFKITPSEYRKQFSKL